MRKMEQIILMQKIENLQNNCLTAMEKLLRVLGHTIFGLILSIN